MPVVVRTAAPAASPSAVGRGHPGAKGAGACRAGQGGGLPVTGPRAGLVAGAGALLVAAGAVALVMIRRRRIITVAG